VNASFTAVLA
jgi:hypothetical protein